MSVITHLVNAFTKWVHSLSECNILGEYTHLVSVDTHLVSVALTKWM